MIELVIEKLLVSEFNDTAEDCFSEKFNLITSNNKNSVGKSTYCRLIFYSLGYAVPSTEGINFEKVFTQITITSSNKSYEIERRNKILYVKEKNSLMEMSYDLPEQHPAFLSYIFAPSFYVILWGALLAVVLMYFPEQKFAITTDGQILDIITYMLYQK